MKSYIKEVKEIFYWSNSSGEINLPKQKGHAKVEDLPFSMAETFRKWYRDDNPTRYVVSYQGVTGILLRALYDIDFVSELTGAKSMSEFFPTFRRYAEKIEKNFDKSCVLMVGNYSDPDGHELYLFIPSDMLPDEEVTRNIQKFQEVAYMDLQKYLVYVSGEYTRNTEILVGDINQYDENSITYDDAIWSLAEGTSVIIGTFYGQDTADAIEQAVEASKNNLCADALCAMELK